MGEGTGRRDVSPNDREHDADAPGPRETAQELGRAVEVIAYYESGDQLARLVWNAERGEAEVQWRR